MRQKLKHLIQTIHENQVNNKKIQYEADLHMLHDKLNEIFPSGDVVEIFYNLLKSSKNQCKDVVSMVNLPAHVRDCEWMVNYIERVVNDSANGLKSNKVKRYSIETFVESDPKFNDRRVQYEEDVVAAEIEDYMDKHNYNVSFRTLEQIKIDCSSNIDELARQEIMNNVSRLNLDHHSIEAGLEKNSYLWLEQTMMVEYYNRFVRPLEMVSSSINARQFEDIKDKVLASFDGWRAIRIFEYGQRHKSIIDELGTATTDMKISPREAMLRSRAWYGNYQNMTQPIYDMMNVKNTDFGKEQN